MSKRKDWFENRTELQLLSIWVSHTVFSRAVVKALFNDLKIQLTVCFVNFIFFFESIVRRFD